MLGDCYNFHFFSLHRNLLYPGGLVGTGMENASLCMAVSAHAPLFDRIAKVPFLLLKVFYLLLISTSLLLACLSFINIITPNPLLNSLTAFLYFSHGLSTLAFRLLFTTVASNTLRKSIITYISSQVSLVNSVWASLCLHFRLPTNWKLLKMEDQDIFHLIILWNYFYAIYDS